jgi:glycosyltransferase involved in cell wall biosynthesis
MNAVLETKTVVEPAPSGGGDGKRVVALMPAYNTGDSINRAVASLVNGTFPCDIYIVDDGSDIPVSRILDNFPRTKIIRLDKNTGVVNARNVGLTAILAQLYDFVALLDADDIAYPDRIARQVEFLDSHPEIAGVGTWARHIAEKSGKPLFIERTPVTPATVRKGLNYNSAIINTTFMVRTNVLRLVGLYSDRYSVAEDYDLFRRISQRFSLSNIPDVLADRQVLATGISLTNRRRQLLDRLRIQLRYLDVWEASAWLGMLKTLVLFLVPVRLLMMVKRYLPSAALLPSVGV